MAPSASTLRFRDRFFGAVDPGAAGLARLLPVLRPRLPGAPPLLASIHADMAVELVLTSWGMTMPFACATLMAYSICAGLTGLGPISVAFASAALLGTCWSRKARQMDPDLA